MKHFNYIFLLLPCCLHAQSLRINPGVQVTMSGAPYLVLNNTSLVNNGRFITDNSTVLFAGATHTYIDGSSPISFYNLTVHIPSGELQLHTNTIVTGTMAMDSGNLQLNTYTLSLGSSGRIMGERNDARITGNSGGTITITTPLDAPHAVNPGNIGVEITSNANLGPTLITRGHVQPDNAQGQTGIQRYFEIAPSLHRDALAALRFYYFDSELGDKNKNELDLFAVPPGQNNWTLQGKDYSDGINNWVLKSNVNPSQRFTLAPARNNTVSGASVQIYPNPAREAFTLLLFSATEKQGIISLSDQSGHVLESRMIHCLPGINKTTWNIAGYAAGAYHLVFNRLDVKNTTILKQ